MSDRIRVFVPTGSVRQPGGPARAPHQNGKSAPVIGLLDNHKHNTSKILDRIEAQLADRLPGARFVRVRKPEAGKSAPPEVLDALTRDCEAVVTGIGD